MQINCSWLGCALAFELAGHPLPRDTFPPVTPHTRAPTCTRPPPPLFPPPSPLVLSSPRAVRTGAVQRPKDKILSMAPAEITYEMVQKKLVEIAMARGKTTRIDRQEQVGWAGLDGRGCWLGWCR